MKSVQTISRDLDAENPYGFSRLRKEGIEISQDLSGLEWTDYNSHDPGVTILEQVCFALTDLIYRTKFDVADYLCDEQGSVPLDALGLHRPQDVFFGRPCTSLDYQKALLGMSTDISDVQLLDEELGVNGEGFGTYRIRIRRNHRKNNGLSEPELKEQTRLNFHSIRNLCDDISGEVEVVNDIDCHLQGELSVKPGFRVATVLAEVYYRASTELEKALNYKSFSEDVKNGVALDAVFEGPLTERGLIDSDLIVHRGNTSNRKLLESAILSAARDIEGVEYLESLQLVAVDKNHDIDNLAALSMLRICDPSSRNDLAAIVTRTNGRLSGFEFDEFQAQFEARMFAQTSKSFDLKEDQLFSGPVKGIHRKLESYQSVQNQFPEAYGINQYGIPDHYSAERKAQALQLKSYLLLFEQIMSNYLANLGSLKELFSFNGKGKASYFSGILNKDEISNLERVYPDKPEEVLNAILGKVDNFLGRKSRLLDYMLALYGEEFTQAHLRNFDFYNSGQEKEKAILSNKIRLLNGIQSASGDRSAAANLYAVKADVKPAAEKSSEKIVRSESVSGLQFRVSNFLGFKHLDSHSLVAELFRHGISLSTNSQNPFVERASEVHGDRTQLTEQEQRHYGILQSDLEKFDGLDSGELNEDLFRSGISNENYLYDENSGELYVNVVSVDRIGNESTTRRVILKEKDVKEVEKRKRFLRCFLNNLNQESEGMHVLEHILLRPADFSAKSQKFKAQYANKVSVIFPSWTARCNDFQFRKLAEDIVQDNCPAHISADVYWIDFDSMCEYEALIKEWSESRLSGSSNDMEQACQALIRFLQLQKSKGSLFENNHELMAELRERAVKGVTDYVNKIMARKKELSMSQRRVPDALERNKLPIERLKQEINSLKISVIEHIRVMPTSSQLNEEEWEFYGSRTSVLVSKFFLFKDTDRRNDFVLNVRKVVEDTIRSQIGSDRLYDIHWIVPSDMGKIQNLYFQLLNAESEDSSAELRQALLEISNSDAATSDLTNWQYLLGDQ